MVKQNIKKKPKEKIYLYQQKIIKYNSDDNTIYYIQTPFTICFFR